VDLPGSMAKSRKRVHRTREEWAALINAWEVSGLGAEAFARDKDFSASSLYIWRTRLSTKPPAEAESALSFVPVVADDAGVDGDAFAWRIQTRTSVVVSMSGPGAKDGLEVAIRALSAQGAL